MAGEDTDLAWLIGLMHDIGRFEQARRYGTFVDSLSVDHAELSADLLFAEGLADRFPQDGLPEDWRNIAETAVRQHNKLKPAETPDDRTRRFIDLIRDADKTDIFRVIATIPFEDRVGSSKANFTETEEASPEVMACVLEHRCVPSRIRHSRFEGHISHCCMAFEMVFEISRKTVKEEGWLLALLAETAEAATGPAAPPAAAPEAETFTPERIAGVYWDVFSGCFAHIDFNPVSFRFHDDGWDSIAQMNLICRLEEAFHISFKGRETMKITSYRAGLELVRKKIRDRAEEK